MEKDKKQLNNDTNYNTVEINEYRSLKHNVNYSVESSNTKEYDILLMTGNSQNNQKGSDKE